jgi:hypothetical protein
MVDNDTATVSIESTDYVCFIDINNASVWPVEIFDAPTFELLPIIDDAVTWSLQSSTSNSYWLSAIVDYLVGISQYPECIYVLSSQSDPLPNGLMLDSVSGLLSGIPTVAGIYHLSFELANSFTLETTPIVNLVLTVPLLPIDQLHRLALVLGAAVGGGVVVALFGVLIAMLFKERRKNAAMPHDFQSMLEALHELHDCQQAPEAPREIKRQHVTTLEMLGHGSFGSVVKAFLSEIPASPGYLVAVKTPLSPDSREAFLREAALMAQFDNAFVVRLIGVVTLGEPLYVVLEYCEHGLLLKYLTKSPMTLKQRYMIAGDVAEGLEYLTSHRFIHRDVAARNVFMSSDHRAKVRSSIVYLISLDRCELCFAGGRLWHEPSNHQQGILSQWRWPASHSLDGA